MRIYTCWLTLIPNTFYLSETCSSTTIQAKNRESCWTVLSPVGDEPDVAPLCSTSNLLITDQGGRTCASFASAAGFPSLCEWQPVLHAGDWARTFAVVPLYVYSAHSEQQSHIYPNLPHCCDTVVQEDSHAAVIPPWEGSGGPSAAQGKTSQWKTARPCHTYGGIFHRDQGSGCVLWILGWLVTPKYFTDNEVRGQMVQEHLASRDTVIVCHLRHFLNLEQCSDAWE